VLFAKNFAIFAVILIIFTAKDTKKMQLCVLCEKLCDLCGYINFFTTKDAKKNFAISVVLFFLTAKYAKKMKLCALCEKLCDLCGFIFFKPLRTLRKTLRSLRLNLFFFNR